MRNYPKMYRRQDVLCSYIFELRNKPFLFKQVKLEGKFNYKPMFRSSIAMLSSGKVLITDRLHSSILAFLLHQPHVYLDQMYGKISKTRGVAFAASANCVNKTILGFDQAVTIEEAVHKAIILMHD